MNILKPNDLHSAIEPILFMCKAFGLFSLVRKNQVHPLSYHISPILVVYGFILLVVINTVNISCLFWWLYANEDPVSDISGVIDSGSLVICHIIGFLCCFIYQNKIIILFHKLFSLEQLLQETYMIIKLGIILQIFVGILLMLLGNAVIWYVSCGELDCIYVYFCFLTISVASYVMELQFVTLTSVIYHHFVKLNSYLMEFELTGLKTLLNKSNHNFNGGRVDSFSTVDSSSEEVCNNSSLNLETCTLTKFHHKLCDIVALIITIYSPYLLFIMAKRLFGITYHLFSIYCTVINPADFIENSLSVVWLFMNIFELLILVFPCTSAVVEASKTGPLVHKLMNRTEDPAVRTELELFSLQLLHRKVEFTACGFFPLDYTLLYSIIGAVTTYLVILIQFQLSYGNDKNNSNTTYTYE